MKKAMESLQDLIEEAKLRTVWWILCIFGVSYFLTHTSKSMLMNVPIAVLLVSGLRILFNEVEFQWKVKTIRSSSYLSHLEKKLLSVNDSRLTTPPPTQKWKRKIDSPVVEAAIEDFINNILHDFVIDLWYSDITPDKEAPELIHGIIMDVLGEISGRIKEVNLVDLLTRDVIDLIGDHLDLYRRNQASIGVDVMGTLSSEERDERLKHHLLASKELHPALISPECEYKVLQRLMGGLLAVVLKPREAQCPLVRCIARELLTCLVVQPIMDFASPGYINELLEYVILAYNTDDIAADQSSKFENQKCDRAAGVCFQSSESKSNLKKSVSSNTEGTDLSLYGSDDKKALKFNASGNFSSNNIHNEPLNPRPVEWAKAFDAVNQRRTEVLMPENLENMWAVGRNYKKNLQKRAAPQPQAPEVTGSLSKAERRKQLVTDLPLQKPETSVEVEDKAYVKLPTRHQQDNQPTNFNLAAFGCSEILDQEVLLKEGSASKELEETAIVSHENRTLKRSNSTSDLHHPRLEDSFTSVGTAPIISEYYSADTKKLNIHGSKSTSDMVIRSEGLHVPKLRCRVVGAYFEKHGSNSFAVYSISVTDKDNNTWFVKRRYRNFERLHRHLKDIPNYTLHLPPKRIFSSSTEDSFVHQRCIQLDEYLQDLLSIANVAEQHEVWDFLSTSSKSYSFGKSTSAMRTLAVNVDDAVDDIVRQFRGVSDGLLRKVVGSPSSFHDPSSSLTSRNLSWNTDEISKLALRESISESINSFSDNEEGDKDVNRRQQMIETTVQANGWHSENDLNSQSSPRRVVKNGEEVTSLDFEEIHGLRMKPASSCSSRYQESSLGLISGPQGDPTAVPPEWTPPNLSVPILNLVDNIFQLKRRGWIRTQVLWISKQILQLVMEDAIDDWLSGQIQWLRKEEVIAQAIRWVHNVLWPDGTFFLRQGLLNDSQSNQGSLQSITKKSRRRVAQPESFDQQLEAARRASYVKKMILDGAPSTLVSLIGYKQYRRCTKDVYYFLQSTICLKQLGYGILELVLISIFPELRDIVRDIHEKMRVQSV